MPVDARTLTLQRPRSLKAALAMLATAPALTPIAGCTDVMVGLHFGTSDQRQFIDLWPLDELRGITLDKPEGLSPRLRIGALTTYTEIIASPIIRKRVPMLVAAAREVGGAQIQNRGTLGGNIANASPAGDTLPVLAAADARIVLRSTGGERRVSFNEFYTEFGIFLKEGAAMDYTHKEQLTKLLRFESSLTDKGKTTSLADYVTRMGAEQKEIYYLVGPNRAALESGPYLEGFKARNLEVIFCYEAVDEYVMSNVREFDGKKLTAADHADVKLSDLPKPEGALSEDDTKKLTAWLKETLGARVEEVKASDRLVDSPALAVNADKFMSPQMRRMMKAMKKDGADEPVKVTLEINPRSVVMKRLFDTHATSPDKAKLVAEQILDNSLISAGLLDDATPMVARLYKLLESV